MTEGAEDNFCANPACQTAVENVRFRDNEDVTRKMRHVRQRSQSGRCHLLNAGQNMRRWTLGDWIAGIRSQVAGRSAIPNAAIGLIPRSLDRRKIAS
jgi:hypothetical protein